MPPQSVHRLIRFRYHLIANKETLDQDLLHSARFRCNLLLGVWLLFAVCSAVSFLVFFTVLIPTIFDDADLSLKVLATAVFLATLYLPDIVSVVVYLKLKWELQSRVTPVIVIYIVNASESHHKEERRSAEVQVAPQGPPPMPPTEENEEHLRQVRLRYTYQNA